MAARLIPALVRGSHLVLYPFVLPATGVTLGLGLVLLTSPFGQGSGPKNKLKSKIYVSNFIPPSNCGCPFDAPKMGQMNLTSNTSIMT